MPPRFELHCGLLCAVFFAVAGSTAALGQVLVAADDEFAVPYGEMLVIEAFGVLDNDTLDGENAGESGATAVLVSDASHGTLTLDSDGSFGYSPGAGFEGSDSFVYRAEFGGAESEATASLSACTGGPLIFTCWKQAAFASKAAELGIPSFFEGFENDDVWGAARSPNTVPNVDSRGFRWQANAFDSTHFDPLSPPPPNHITTGSGPARSGGYGVFDLAHGYAPPEMTPTGCDVDDPDPPCLYHDGFTIVRQAGSNPLHGAGGYFTGTFGANVGIILDGDIANPLGGGTLSGGAHRFFGVIDAGPAGLEQIQFRELDGKVGQALFLFGDDFTVLAEPTPLVPALGGRGRLGLLVLFVVLGGLARRRFASP